MRHDTMQRALLVTAKVTLGLWAVGCGGHVEEVAESHALGTGGTGGGTTAESGGASGGTPATSAAGGAGSAGNGAAGAMAAGTGGVPGLAGAPAKAGAAGAAGAPGAAGAAGAATASCGDTTELLCCASKLEGLTASLEPNLPIDPQLDDEQRSCCKMVIAHLDASLDDASGTWGQTTDLGGLTWQDANVCCGMKGIPLGPTCFPWGPPAPPAFVEMAA